MKEDKKKPNAKKKPNTKPTSAPKVKEAKVNETHAEFADVEDDGDKRLVVFIAIALLVIVGTIIGLLVGCEKKKDPEPEKPTDDIVVPEKKDDKDEDDGVKTKEIVRKVKSVYKAKKTVAKNTTTEETETKSYDITFYLGEESKVVKATEGNTIPPYVPIGYKTCTYYKDSELTEEFNIDEEEATEAMNIYMACEATVYSVVYEGADSAGNPDTYVVTDGTVTLNNPTVEGYFNGWYLEEAHQTKVTALDKALLEEVMGETITLYAYVTEEPAEETDFTPADGENTTTGLAPETPEATEPLDGEEEGEGKRAIVVDLEEDPEEEPEKEPEKEPEEEPEQEPEKEFEEDPEEEPEEDPEEEPEKEPEQEPEKEPEKAEEPEKKDEDVPPVEEDKKEIIEEDKKIPETVKFDSGENDEGNKKVGTHKKVEEEPPITKPEDPTPEEVEEEV